MTQGRFVIPFSQLRMTDVDIVGGKNASLGELLSQLTEAGIRVPDGFATTAEAFRVFLKEGGLDKRIEDRLSKLDVDDVKELAKAGAEIREWIEKAPFPAQLEKEIREHYEWLKGDQKEISVAVRSSATAEDLPDASFAGQQETYLNVVGLEQVFARMKEVFASLYNDRGTYAPAMMFGRNAWFDAMSTAGNKCCTYMPGSAMEIESLIQQIQSDPANIIITNLSARYGDNDTTIVVRVEGMRNSSAKDGSRITVMLTEDNIAAHGQMGAEGSFTHQHVTRAINSIWGEPIEWDGNKFSYEVSLGLNTVYFTKNDKVQAGNFEEAWRMWNRDNLNIVAFVNYYSKNVEGCAVENVEGAKFNDAINGIEDLPQTKESQTVRSEVYTIDGKRIEADQMGRGLYIIRDIQADGSVHTRKVMRK